MLKTSYRTCLLCLWVCVCVSVVPLFSSTRWLPPPPTSSCCHFARWPRLDKKGRRGAALEGVVEKRETWWFLVVCVALVVLLPSLWRGVLEWWCFELVVRSVVVSFRPASFVNVSFFSWFALLIKIHIFCSLSTVSVSLPFPRDFNSRSHPRIPSTVLHIIINAELQP